MNNRDNNKEFDDYINKLMSKDTVVPSGFEWDNMDIEIPKKKDRRPYFLLFAIIGLVFCSFLGGYYIKDNLSNVSDSKDLGLSDYREKPVEKSAVDTSNSASFTKTKNSIKRAIVSSNSYDDIENQEISSVRSDGRKSGLDLESNKISSTLTFPSLDKNSIGFEGFILPSQEYKTNMFLIGINKNSAKISALNSKEKTRSMINFLTLDPVSEKLLLQDRAVPVIGLDRKINNIPIDTDLKNKLYVMIGSNYSSIKFSESSILKDKTQSRVGMAASIGLERILKNKVFYSIGLNYQRLHSVFTHNKELGINYDFNSLIRTTQIEKTYHNNFSQYIGLEIGLGNYFSLTRKLSLRSQLSISPQYLLSISGKTLVDDEIVLLEYLDNPQQLILSVKPSLGIDYNVFGTFSLGLSYQYTHTLYNDFYINNESSTQNNHQILMGLNIKF